jgi:hypothetical protein
LTDPGITTLDARVNGIAVSEDDVTVSEDVTTEPENRAVFTDGVTVSNNRKTSLEHCCDVELSLRLVLLASPLIVSLDARFLGRPLCFGFSVPALFSQKWDLKIKVVPLLLQQSSTLPGLLWGLEGIYLQPINAKILTHVILHYTIQM